MKLSTTYTDPNKENNDPRKKIYVPRSKYKIFDPETGRTLTFEKTASGDYVRSNSATATDTISLRAGEVTVTGIEVGTYQLGLVDLTEKYGVINTEPEVLTIESNAAVEKEVPVQVRYAFKKVAVGHYRAVAVREDGVPYLITDYTYRQEPKFNTLIDNGPILLEKLYPELAGVKVKDLDVSGNNYILIIDEDGKVWTNYANNSTFECLSDIEDHPFNNVRIDKCYVGTGEKTSDLPDNVVIDENGKAWYWGSASRNNSFIKYAVPSGTTSVSQYAPVCISENTILENVKLEQFSFYQDTAYAVDVDGNLYAWGNNTNSNLCAEGLDSFVEKPICITTLEEGSNLIGKKIKDVSAGYNYVYIVDYAGDLWFCGVPVPKGIGDGYDYRTTITNPMCITQINEHPLEDKSIESVHVMGADTVVAVDSNGKLWGWGSYSEWIGAKSSENSDLPQCISSRDDNNLQTVKLVQVGTGYGYVSAASDENGDIWLWGATETMDTIPLGYIGNGSGTANVPSRLNFTQNAYFDLFEVNNIGLTYQNDKLILDKSGKLWKTGNIDYLLYDANGNTSLDNYNSHIVGTEIENITVKDFSVDDYNTVIIDSDNKLWNIGYGNRPYGRMSTLISDTSNMKALCLSDIADSGIANKEIKYATTFGISTNLIISVIDSTGKLYTAGANNGVYNLGYKGTGLNGTDISKFECLNEKYSNLENVEFEKVSLYQNQTAAAVDTEGNVWLWGRIGYGAEAASDVSAYTIGSGSSSNCAAPTKLIFPNNAKIVDVIVDYRCGAAIDEDGNVYAWNSAQSTPTLLTNSDNLLGGKKIVKIGFGYNGYVYAVDDNGEVFEINISNGQVLRSITSQYEIVAKDIYTNYGSGGTTIIKDTDDQLWKIDASGATKLTGYSNNDLYGKTIVDVLSGNQVVATENGQRIIYELSGNNVTSKYKDENVVYISGSYFNKFNINENGKIKYSTQSLNRELTTDVTFNKLVKISGTSNSYPFTLAIADNKDVYFCNATSATKVEGLSNIEEAWAAYNSNVVAIFAKDSSGKLWFVIYKTSTSATVNDYIKKLSGLPDVEDYTVPHEIQLSDNATVKDMYVTYYAAYCLDSQDRLWQWGRVYQASTSASAANSATPRIFIENTQIESYNIFEVSTTYLSGAALDKSGKLWTWGYNNYAQLGTGNKTHVTTPVNISDTRSIGTVKEYSFVLVGSSNNRPSMWIIDANNDLYYWGGSGSKLSPSLVKEDVDAGVRLEGNTLITTNGEVYTLAESGAGSSSVGVITKKYLTDNIDKFGDSTTGSSLILKKDGKLYRYLNGELTCLSDSTKLVNELGKKFYLIKDAKYND